MLRSNSKKAVENIRGYIRDNFQVYDGDTAPDSFKGIAAYIIDTFIKEGYAFENQRRYYHHNVAAAFDDWVRGLPSVLDLEMLYRGSAVDALGDILEETAEERNTYTETEAESMLIKLIYRELRKVRGAAL